MSIGTPTLILNANSVNTNSGSASAGTTVDAPAGSLVVAALSAITLTDSIKTLVDSAGNSYSAAVVADGTNINCELWYCSNTNNNLPIGGTFTATTTNGGKWYYNGFAYVSGANGGLDKTNSTTSSSEASYNLGTGSLSVPNEVVFGTNFTSTSFPSYVEDSGFTELTGSPSSNTSGQDFCYQVVSSSAGVTWSPSWTGNVIVTAVIATFEASDIIYPQSVM